MLPPDLILHRSARVLRWLHRSPVQTFILCPLLVVAFELVRQRRELAIEPTGFVLLAWGYLQYLLVGRFRTRVGGGGPGFGVPPDRIVEDGPYRYVRNPMYLGHLIFMLGLAVTFVSWFALLLFAARALWFHRRVLKDEARLQDMFGRAYLDYRGQVKRWIPGLL
jgi:protein-S-isoprenylcysteine O-methyltransferase Ste14